MASNLILPRHSTGIEIAHGDDTGADGAVAGICRGFGVRAVIFILATETGTGPMPRCSAIERSYAPRPIPTSSSAAPCSGTG